MAIFTSLMVLCCVVAASGQQIVFKGPAGCAELRPTSPRNLRAQPGNGQVTLTWDAPGNGACVSRYVVAASESSMFRSSGGRGQSTSGFSLVITGLENGKTYTFTVTAFSDKFNGGDSSSVTTTLPQFCKPETPGQIVNLRVDSTGDRFIQICWDGVANQACVDEYRVSAVPAGAQMFRTSNQLISKGGCLKVTDLENGKDYILSVAGYSNTYGEGRRSDVRATPRRWR